jgi:ferredoxin-thioredoxin reductase catalytic subunit
MTRLIGYWDKPIQNGEIKVKDLKGCANSKDCLSIGFLFSKPNLGRIKMPCGYVFDMREFEVKDTPCPCGSKDCWLIKVE